ncbi:MAG: hypothetical protein WC763_01910 [Candidatus Paceibacterota bacterium]
MSTNTNSKKLDGASKSLEKHPFLWWIGVSIVLFIIIGKYSLFISFALLLLAALIRSQKKASERKSSLVAEADKYVELVRSSNSLPVIETKGAIFLDQDEHLFLRENVELRETRSVRKSSGGFGSVRIMKGVSVGRYAGSSKSSLEWASLDRGEVFVTNKKIVFMGSKENRTIPLKKVLGIETLSDAIEITVDGRSKAVQFPVSNPYIWGIVMNIVKSVPNPLDLGDAKLNIQLS